MTSPDLMDDATFFALQAEIDRIAALRAERPNPYAQAD